MSNSPATPADYPTSSPNGDTVGATPGVIRGCGVREEGAAYVECAVTMDGAPFESFWCDPPIEYEPESALGQQIIERDGTSHIVDHIGSGSYPYPCDFLEEMRFFGLSRRISKTFDFDRLSPESRIILTHSRAVAEDPAFFFEHMSREVQDTDALLRHRSRCALFREGDERHIEAPTGEPCTRFWYVDADGDASIGARLGYERPLALHGEVADARYKVSSPFDVDPSMTEGIIASFPVHRIAVVQASDGSHTDTVDDIQAQAPVPVIEQAA